jgi:hypothetical protein
MKKLLFALCLAVVMSSTAAHALDPVCEAEGEFASAMVQERDRGVTKKEALAKLKKAGNGNVKVCRNIINLLWTDKSFKKLSEDGAYRLFGAGCQYNVENGYK